MSFDQRQFAGQWWEVARLEQSAGINDALEICPRSGLQSANFASKALLWIFDLKNEGYYSLTLKVYDEDAIVLEKVYKGVAVVRGSPGHEISFSLYDEGQAIELGVYTILTVHSDLALLGKKALVVQEEVVTRRTSVSRERGATVEREEVAETEFVGPSFEGGGCKDDELIVLSREPLLTPTQRDTMLVSAEHFGFDGSRLISSRPTVIEPDIKYLPKVLYSNPGKVPLTATPPTTKVARSPRPKRQIQFDKAPVRIDAEEEVEEVIHQPSRRVPGRKGALRRVRPAVEEEEIEEIVHRYNPREDVIVEETIATSASSASSAPSPYRTYGSHSKLYQQQERVTIPTVPEASPVSAKRKVKR